jgi:hypothetical protein
MQTAIDPLKLKLADLEVLEARDSGAMRAIEKAEQHYKPITQRDARQRMIGMMKMINHFSGGDMRQEIDTIDFLVQRIDVLEEENAKLREQFEAEKLHYRQALAAVGKVIDLYSGDPFELKPISKWSKADLGKWMIAAGESIKWVMQRAENALDPDHAVPIVKDPE